MKRVMTIQDISCVGKCSLTVALPILSAAGIETAVLPTAVLSTHTAFSSFTFCDLTDQIAPITQELSKQDITFDAIYSGYLGSVQQTDLVGEFFDTFHNEGNCIVVDPVMGDHGRLYPGFDRTFARHMAKLCGKADIIMPNLTEAAYLLERDYQESYSKDEVSELLRALCELGCRTALITGVTFEDGKLGVAGYDSKENRYFTYFNRRIDAVFHGTGDCFASALTGALVQGKSIEDATRIAADFTADSIQATLADPDHRWYGVNFETLLPNYAKRVNE